MVGKKGPEVPGGGQHRERMLHTHPSCSFSEGELAPNAAANDPLPGQGSYVKAALTRLPAPLVHMGRRHLVLGGPSLLQALWAIAVPIGICTQERQSGLWDTIGLGLDSDHT